MNHQLLVELKMLDYQVLEHSRRGQLVGVFLRGTACGVG